MLERVSVQKMTKKAQEKQADTTQFDTIYKFINLIY